MGPDEDLFKVEDELQKRLRNKYRAFKTKVIESNLGPAKVEIQLRIAEVIFPRFCGCYETNIFSGIEEKGLLTISALKKIIPPRARLFKEKC